MVDHLHRCEPEPVYLRVLLGYEAPGVFLPLLQGISQLQSHWMDDPSHPACVRVDEEPVPGHAGALQRLQAAVPERDAEDAGRRRAKGSLIAAVEHDFLQHYCWTGERVSLGLTSG